MKRIMMMCSMVAIALTMALPVVAQDFRESSWGDAMPLVLAREGTDRTMSQTSSGDRATYNREVLSGVHRTRTFVVFDFVNQRLEGGMIVFQNYQDDERVVSALSSRFGPSSRQLPDYRERFSEEIASKMDTTHDHQWWWETETTIVQLLTAPNGTVIIYVNKENYLPPTADRDASGF